MANIEAKAVELRLLSWSESATAGAKVVFEISPDDLEWFRTMTAGKKVGQRIQAAMVYLNDDGSPANVELPGDQEPPKEQQLSTADPEHHPTLSQQAAVLCKDLEFHRYLNDVQWVVTQGSEDAAAQWLRKVCGVASRSDIPLVPTAKSRFEEILREFTDWRHHGDLGRLLARRNDGGRKPSRTAEA